MYILNIEPLPVSEGFKSAISTEYTLVENVDEKDFDFEKVKGIYCRFSHQLDSAFLSKYKNLRFILCNATGTDHIDREHCENNDISIFDLGDAAEFLRENVTSSAEHTWCLLLAAARKFKKHQINLQSGIFNRNIDFGMQLKGKTLGIVGLGRNGLQLATFARAFQMEVRYFDPFVSKKDLIRDDNLFTLFQKVDFVVLCVKLRPDTRFLIDHRVLSNCTGVHLINTSRGEIVVESDILHAIEVGKLLSYSTDVISNELDYQDSKIYKQSLIDNKIIVTPHIGGATSEAWSITELYLAKKLKHWKDK